ncbi:MAG: hypothetical protein LBL00_05525, partial [Endomicrobium sp.]|nr:hypothetical protein [Endomicrobium sp.]
MTKLLTKNFIAAFIVAASAVFLSSPLRAQDAKDYEHFSSFNGKKIENINVSTNRIKPQIVKNKFLIKEGDIFAYKNFDYARKAVHDMRIFKEMDIEAEVNAAGNLDININGRDGYYVFPLPIVMSSGGSTTFALMVMEANLFKRGELATFMGAYGDDGYMGMLGLHLNDNSFNLFFIDQDYTQKLYKGGAYNSTGLFGNSDDDHGKTVINEYNVQKTSAALSYGRSLGEKLSFNIAYLYQDIDYKAKTAASLLPDDAGYHHQFSAGISLYHNIKPSKGMAGAFGSIFGMGTSDKEHRLANLPYVKSGYFASLEYGSGGSYTGADYDISKLSASVMGNLELKTRHTIYAVIN